MMLLEITRSPDNLFLKEVIIWIMLKVYFLHMNTFISSGYIDLLANIFFKKIICAMFWRYQCYILINKIISDFVIIV